MQRRVVPDVRPALAVLLRAGISGAVAGLLLGVVLELVPLTQDDPGGALVVLGYAGAAGSALALVSALGWLLAVGHGPRWVAELVAALVAAAPFVLVWFVAQATILLIVALLVGVVAGLTARWQGYERGGRPSRATPRSSPRAG